MNRQQTDTNPKLRVALNVRLPDDGSLPEWVELVPAGEVVIGRDRRSWINPTPDEVVAAFEANGADLPIDWEHATELKAPEGKKAPAAGWIKEMEVREGAIWGRTEWTPDGADDVVNKRYRYISPVFIFTTQERRILAITSAGLTNQPNLFLTALNHQEHFTQETDMKFPKALCQQLGVSEDATEEQVMAAVAVLKGDLQTAQNRAETPSLEKFVPRGDYNAAVERATNAEQKLKTHEEKGLETEIDTAINSALEGGKITPATAEYHKAQCRSEGGLERFKAFVEAAPEVAGASGLDGKEPQDKGGSLTDDEKATCRQLDITEEDYLKHKKEIG